MANPVRDVAIEHTELISLVAEVAATFIGFSLAIGLLQPDQPSAARRIQSMHSVAELAMIAAGGALLALALDAFQLSSELVWRGASTIIFVLWLALHMLAVRRFKRVGTLIAETRFLQIAATIAFVGMGLLLWNAVNPGEHSGAIFTAALILALADSAFLFILSTFSDRHDHTAG